MPSPTPNGPTLADLQYGSYNQGGLVRVTTGFPDDFIGSGGVVNDAVNTRENVVLDLVGYTTSVDTSDFLNTTENVNVVLDIFNLDQLKVTVNDSTTTSENIQLP